MFPLCERFDIWPESLFPDEVIPTSVPLVPSTPNAIDRFICACLLPVGDVVPARLLGPFGGLAVVDRLGVQQSGPVVKLELLGRTGEK